MRPRSRKYLIGLGLIFLCGLALRIGCATAFVGLDAPPSASANPDQLDYEALAWRVVTGQGYVSDTGQPTAMRVPGTSLALMPVYALWGRSWTAGRLWFCLISATTCLAAAWAARQALGQGAALLTAALVAFYPGAFYYSMHFLSEVPFGLWTALAVGCTLAALRENNAGQPPENTSSPRRLPALAWHLAAGICWGMTILTRGQMIFILPAAFLMLVLARGRARWFYARHLALESLVVLLVLSPWLARNAIVMGKPMLAASGAPTFWGGYNDLAVHDPQYRGRWVPNALLRPGYPEPFPESEVEQERYTWRAAFAWIKSHPYDLPQLYMWRAWRLVSVSMHSPNRIARWAFAAGWAICGPLLLWGAMIAYRQWNHRLAVLAAPILATAMIAFVFCATDRFRDAVAPLFLTFSALGAQNILQGLFRARTGIAPTAQQIPWLRQAA